MNHNQILANEETLDPENWEAMRKLGHRMLDDMMDYLQNIRDKPVWQQPSDESKALLNRSLPQHGQPIEEIYEEFLTQILPHNKGNVHPRFFGWVQGAGTPLGMLADMLAAGMNPNTGMGDHAAIYVEHQVIEWCKEMFNFPEQAGGILVSGATMANVVALNVARNSIKGLKIRKKGVDSQLVMYCSTETHICVIKGAEVLGIGSERVRLVPVNDAYEIEISSLRAMILADLSAGMKPFCVVGNAGTVNTAANDSMDEIYAICQEFGLWFHVDGAFGSLAKLTPEFSVKLQAIEKADSLSFDFHKWMHVPYESACVLIRDKKLQRAAFANTPNYLLAHERGLAAGPESMSNYGIELSRSFKSLKVWMSLKENGIQKYARLIRQNIAQAHYLEEIIENRIDLELLAPVSMNIVCFRFVGKNAFSEEKLNILNKEILMTLHESGVAAPSYTMLKGKYAIRTNITNHRTVKEDLDLMIEKIIEIGNELIK